MTDDIRMGIIGPGVIAPSHAFAINKARGARLAAVCGRRLEPTAELADQYGAEPVTDIAALLDAVDAVTLCTPSGAHLDIALEVIAAGKNLLIEKPLETTPERIDQIVAAARQQDIVLGGVFQSRFAPIARQLNPLVAAGLLGMLTMLLSSLNERRREMAILRSVGCRPVHVFGLFVTETAALTAAGAPLQPKQRR